MPQLVNTVTVDNTQMQEGTITGNGRYTAYTSNSINSGNDNSFSATLKLHSVVPDREGLGKAFISLVAERQDDGGNWHVFHSLANPVQVISYGPNENGGIIPDFELKFGPGEPTSDEVNGLITKTDGVNETVQIHPDKGTVGSTIRFQIYVHERDFGNVGAFQSMTYSLDYELY